MPKPKTEPTARSRRTNGDGSLYFDKSKNRWRGAVTLPNGSRRRVSAATRPEAAARLRELHGSIASGRELTEKATVAQFLNRWIERFDNGDPDPNTVDNYRWAIGHLNAQIGPKRLGALRTEHIDWALAELADAGLGRSSVSRARSLLRQALDDAVGQGLIARNWADHASMPRTAPPTPRRGLNPDQAAAFLAAAAGHRLEAYIVTALMLGLRPGEMLGLTWAAVDFDAGTLTVKASLRRRRGAPAELGDVKGGIDASRRVLAMPPEVATALRAQRSRQAEARLAAGQLWKGNDHGLVFTTDRGTPFSDSNLRRAISALTRDAGLGHWSPNELGRHSAASLLSHAGVRLEVVADVLGHSSTRMLEERYRHNLGPAINGHVGVLDGLLAAR